jgi:hypothetical protein
MDHEETILDLPCGNMTDIHTHLLKPYGEPVLLPISKLGH